MSTLTAYPLQDWLSRRGPAQAAALILTGVLLLAGTLPAAGQAQNACAQDVIVQPGDTLSRIAGRTLGNVAAYAQIVAATNAQAGRDASYATITNPNVLAVGWKLCIPVARQTPAPVSPLPAPLTADSNQGTEEPSELAKRRTPDGPHPLTIAYLRDQAFPGSAPVIEQTLAPGSNYQRYIVSYRSEGLKINGLMTVPNGPKPASGWPVIVFNHGYIPPEVYRPTERYVAYVDGFARAGYIVLRPDYRGHADSEGEATGAYGDPGYTIDVINAVSSIKQYPDADPNRIGLWGHSMGGYITARAMVVRGDIRAGVIWAGVVGSYDDLLNNWNRAGRIPSTIPQRVRRWRQELLDEFGTPAQNPAFWDSISTNSYVADLSGPIQLHHGTADADVPVAFSERLYNDILAAGGIAELYIYPGDDHNLSVNFNTAMQRSVAFFDRYVKGP